MSAASAAAAEPRLRITEIFLSLQGETTLTGWPTVFVRLTGCPLRCRYCDTSYAFAGGESLSVEAVLERVRGFGVRHVCVTGGEPLAQRGCPLLLASLCDTGYVVSLETSGALDIGAADERVARIVDLKTPGSGETARNLWDNVSRLTPHDQVKFVVCDRGDYEWARDAIAKHRLNERCVVLMSPSHEQLPARELAEWILGDRLPVRFQIQLHKVLWGNERAR
ncbi:MAG TPA: 7-carboxy-7-deazaguanine synthase QueE [Candidatus Binatia bacterium]|nr:7-carboxy-7-deazaguanine synthase QueE [Candidatus Binatia bacterium]